MLRTTLFACLTGLALPAAMAQLVTSDAPPAASGWRVETVAEGISHPWSMAWLPDGRMLVTSRSGTLHVLNGKQFDAVPMEGLPPIFNTGQGGLFEVLVHPSDKKNPRIYLTLATGTSDANRTTLVQGNFDGKKLQGIKEIFRVQPDKAGGQHFGGKMIWQGDGNLLMSIGDGGNPPARIGDRLAREQAQNLATHHGSILRLTDKGTPAAGNLLSRMPGALPEIWSYGHRNIQGMVRDASGRIWATEHGPRGGDELNLIVGGQNYGWPMQSYGADYKTGEPVGQKVVAGMTQPKIAWVPSTGASGLVHYNGSQFPQWRGNLLSGGLATMDVRRIVLDSQGNVTLQERLAIGARVRDVRQGPDGHIYLVTDDANGKLMRIVKQ